MLEVTSNQAQARIGMGSQASGKHVRVRDNGGETEAPMRQALRRFAAHPREFAGRHKGSPRQRIIHGTAVRGGEGRGGRGTFSSRWANQA